MTCRGDMWAWLGGSGRLLGEGEHRGRKGLVGSPLKVSALWLESASFLILWSEIPYPQTALKQGVQAQFLLETRNISLDLVSKVISGASGEMMTKLGWLLYLFGMEWSVGSHPVLLFLAGCGTEEDSKQWGTLHLCLFCLLVTFPTCHFWSFIFPLMPSAKGSWRWLPFFSHGTTLAFLESLFW